MKTIPFTIDGSEIALDAPRSEGMSDEDAAAIAAKADEFRDVVLHCHYDLVGRDITLYAANAPDGPVVFGFGDGSADLTEDSVDAQASATHTYLADGVYTVQIATATERWFMNVAVNWPPPAPVPPPPEGAR